MGKIMLMHAGFIKSAKKYPNNVALCIGSSIWTYNEVESKAMAWAEALLKIAPRKKSKRIGIFSYRSETSYIGMLAALYAGYTFVPINPRFPDTRNKSIINQAKLDAIITDTQYHAQLENIIKDNQRLPIVIANKDTISFIETSGKILTKDLNKEIKNLPENLNVDPKDFAYLLFTSGSTGLPKGVPISHYNVVHFLNLNQKRYKITPEDRVSQTFDQTFDLSLFDIFMAWSHGASLYVIDPIQLLAPINFVQKNNITVWFSVPSVINLLRKKNLLSQNSLPSLRLSLFCGEALSKQAVQSWEKAASNSVIENLYGPTELTIACAAYLWDPYHSPKECLNDIVPIGQLYMNHNYIIINENMEPISSRVPGELCVNGPQCFSGYWNNNKETEKRFVTIVDDLGNKKKYYRTGDLVIISDKGNLNYLGRIDNQIKINGYRIELQEIEAAIRDVANVTEVIACGYKDIDNFEKIIAFVMGNVCIDNILKALKSKLPTYMIPSKIQVVEEIPLNSNGKADRNLLLQKYLAIDTLGKKEQMA